MMPSISIAQKRREGGVNFRFKNLLARESISILNDDMEVLGLTFQKGDIRNNLLGLYRPPQGSRQKFISTLDNICNTTLKNTDSIIAGDFNIDISINSGNSYCSKELSNMMRSNGYYNLITNITR